MLSGARLPRFRASSGKRTLRRTRYLVNAKGTYPQLSVHRFRSYYSRSLRLFIKLICDSSGKIKSPSSLGSRDDRLCCRGTTLVDSVCPWDKAKSARRPSHVGESVQTWDSFAA